MDENDIEIRFVNSWDVDEIKALYTAGGWWKESYDAETIPRLIAGSFRFAVVIVKKTGKAIAMGRVLSDGVSDAYIQDLCVLPEYRGYNIGTKLVQALLTQCQTAGITWIGLIAEPGSTEFYHHLGFKSLKNHIPLLYHQE